MPASRLVYSGLDTVPAEVPSLLKVTVSPAVLLVPVVVPAAAASLYVTDSADVRRDVAGVVPGTAVVPSVVPSLLLVMFPPGA